MPNYPGTSRPIVPRQPSFAQYPLIPYEEGADEYRWDAKPYILAVQGFPREFFLIGHLSGALMRSAMTVRGWEAKGYFPKPTFTVRGDNPHARRRLYTRPQIEGVVEIAQEEGILDFRKRYITGTNFTPRVFALFLRCRDAPPPITSNSKDSR